MKKIFLFAAFAGLLALCGCGDKFEDDKIMRFYLSSPRDPELVGWWVNETAFKDGSVVLVFNVFNADGTAYVDMHYDNGSLWYPPVSYWYSKDGVYHIFDRPNSYVHWKGEAGSTESHIKYEVRADELWTNRTGSWKSDGKRTTPQQ